MRSYFWHIQTYTYHFLRRECVDPLDNFAASIVDDVRRRGSVEVDAAPLDRLAISTALLERIIPFVLWLSEGSLNVSKSVTIQIWKKTDFSGLLF